MPNRHLEHPEDTILLSRRKCYQVVCTLMQEQIPLGVKWDGAPAIVFGTDPRNNKFFVGTKSVFNKKRVKICYSYEDIDENYKGELVSEGERDGAQVAQDQDRRKKTITRGVSR